jgi:hypothetical protein
MGWWSARKPVPLVPAETPTEGCRRLALGLMSPWEGSRTIRKDRVGAIDCLLALANGDSEP